MKKRIHGLLRDTSGGVLLGVLFFGLIMGGTPTGALAQAKRTGAGQEEKGAY